MENKYFENKEFSKWVLKNQKNESFWEKYIAEHQEDKKEIEEARFILSHLRPQPVEGINTISKNLFSSLNSRLRFVITKKRVQKIAIQILSYAAIALIFFIVGNKVFTSGSDFQLSEIGQQLVINQGVNESKLVLSNGRIHYLHGKDSEVMYLEDHKVKINNKRQVSSKSSTGKSDYNQIIAAFGKNVKVTLRDGTKAYLNAGTRLIYPETFKGNKREVYLVGEGYFEIAHNPDKPFFVNTNIVNVEAKGTAFNVAAYSTESKVEVVLVEGKVGLKENSNSLLRDEYILEPNQMAVFERSMDKPVISEVLVENYTSWHNGFISFKSIELQRIISQLSFYYDIKIHVENKELLTKKMTGKLVFSDDKENALKVLASTTELQIIKLKENVYRLK